MSKLLGFATTVLEWVTKSKSNGDIISYVGQH